MVPPPGKAVRVAVLSEEVWLPRTSSAPDEAFTLLSSMFGWLQTPFSLEWFVLASA